MKAYKPWCVALAFAVFACGGNTVERRVLASNAGAPASGGAPAQGGSSMSSTGGADAGAAGAGARPSCEKTADNSAGDLELVTLSVDCLAADGDAAFSRPTTDGRYVAFDSDAADLVPGDLNGNSDAFLFDLETRELELISMNVRGEPPPSGYSYTPVPSDDARYVAFTAITWQLIGVPEEGRWVFLRDRQSGTTRQLLADYACTYWIDMSDGARFVVAEGFSNCPGSRDAGDFDSTVEYDITLDQTRSLGSAEGADNYRPALSRDGRFLLWATRPPMTRGQQTSQLQLFDRMTDTVEVLPMQAFDYGSTDISDSGQIVAFTQDGAAYRYDLVSEESRLISVGPLGEAGDGLDTDVSMSGNGRYLVFRSTSTNLVNADTNGVADIFIYDALGDTLERLSVAADGSEADDESRYPAISGNASLVTYASKARNLVPAATSGNWQLYARRLHL